HVECDGAWCAEQLQHHQCGCRFHDRQARCYVDDQPEQQDLRQCGAKSADYWQRELPGGRWGDGGLQSSGWRECQCADLSHQCHVECDGAWCVEQLQYLQCGRRFHDRQARCYVDDQPEQQDLRQCGAKSADYWQRELPGGRRGDGGLQSSGWRECQCADLSHQCHVECDGAWCVEQLQYHQCGRRFHDRQARCYVDDQPEQQDLRQRGAKSADYWQRELPGGRRGDSGLQSSGWRECQCADLSHQCHVECDGAWCVEQLQYHQCGRRFHDRQARCYVDDQPEQQDLRQRGAKSADYWQRELPGGRRGDSGLQSSGWRECQSADLSHQCHVECDGAWCVEQLQYHQCGRRFHDRQARCYVDDQPEQQDLRQRGAKSADYWQRELPGGRRGDGGLQSSGWRECQSADLSHQCHVECDGA